MHLSAAAIAAILASTAHAAFFHAAVPAAARRQGAKSVSKAADPPSGAPTGAPPSSNHGPLQAPRFCKEVDHIVSAVSAYDHASSFCASYVTVQLTARLGGPLSARAIPPAAMHAGPAMGRPGPTTLVKAQSKPAQTHAVPTALASFEAKALSSACACIAQLSHTGSAPPPPPTGSQAGSVPPPPPTAAPTSPAAVSTPAAASASTA